MSEFDEQKVAKEKAAIDAMKNAKSNMATAISRIETLEMALQSARDRLSKTKGYIGPDCYAWSANGSQRRVHEVINDQLADIDKIL